jgi:hypothetical protein
MVQQGTCRDVIDLSIFHPSQYFRSDFIIIQITKMLLLRAPYGEEKLFALIAPAVGRQRMGNGPEPVHNVAPALGLPHKNAASEPCCGKSNHYYPQGAPVLGKHTQQHISGDPEKQ